jgi:hypothetical protein
MKSYHLYRVTENNWQEPHCDVIDSATGARYPLRDTHRHGQGFEWGYGGTGPSNLACAIWQEFLGRPHQRDQWWPCQQLKEALLQYMPREGGVITDRDLADWWASFQEDCEKKGDTRDWQGR